MHNGQNGWTIVSYFIITSIFTFYYYSMFFSPLVFSSLVIIEVCYGFPGNKM